MFIIEKYAYLTITSLFFLRQISLRMVAELLKNAPVLLKRVE